MNNTTTFDEVLDAIEHLPVEQQADLVDVVRRRLVDRGRQRIVADAKAARAELAAGQTQPTSLDDLRWRFDRLTC
ncbi:MAG TPA: hypothetical protein VGN72_18555 [Tepidisphaeraceae bacterium]|jgi:hypothetical protein|nr:hypothetical protein [Tepidisphaeraceae bacterium]